MIVTGAYVIVFAHKSMCVWVYERHAERTIGSIPTGHFSTSKMRVWVWWVSFYHRNRWVQRWKSDLSLYLRSQQAESSDADEMNISPTPPTPALMKLASWRADLFYCPKQCTALGKWAGLWLSPSLSIPVSAYIYITLYFTTLYQREQPYRQLSQNQSK